MKRIIVACALLACLPASAQQIHRWVDADGRVQYSDKPPPGVKSAPVQSRISSYSGTPVVSGTASAGATRPEVKMYSTDWCGYCRQARQFFARQGIRYTEHDVEKSPAARDEYQHGRARRSGDPRRRAAHERLQRGAPRGDAQGGRLLG